MKCITVSYGRVRGKAKNYPYYQPCLYHEYITKDNRRVWKLDDVCGMARRSLKLAIEDAKLIAKNKNVPYIYGVRQWGKINV